MALNNEIGVLQPLKEIGALCREKKVRMCCFPVCFPCNGRLIFSNIFCRFFPFSVTFPLPNARADLFPHGRGANAGESTD